MTLGSPLVRFATSRYKTLAARVENEFAGFCESLTDCRVQRGVSRTPRAPDGPATPWEPTNSLAPSWTPAPVGTMMSGNP